MSNPLKNILSLRGKNTISFRLNQRKLENKLLFLQKLPLKIFRKFHYSKQRGKPRAVQIVYKFGFSKGKKIKNRVFLPDKPEYYFTSTFYPTLVPITPTRVKNFMNIDLEEKMEIFSTEQGYMDIGQLRDVTIRYIY